MLRVLIPALLICGSASARCPEGQGEFTSCRIAGRDREVSVCYDDRTAHYTYGPVGGPPELALSEPIATIAFEPWPGVGSSIWETVTFRNGALTYTVSGGFDRPQLDGPDDDSDAVPRPFGGIEVARDGTLIATLDCVPETVSFAYGGGIYDMKVAAGQTWDEATRRWLPPAQ